MTSQLSSSGTTGPGRELSGDRREPSWEVFRAGGRPHARRRWIERLWADGLTAREISECVGSILNISTLRRRGYDLPHRRSQETIRRMTENRKGDPTMAAARAAKKRA